MTELALLGLAVFVLVVGGWIGFALGYQIGGRVMAQSAYDAGVEPERLLAAYRRNKPFGGFDA